MRLVQATDEGVIELSFMWLPTFIGLNAIKLRELEEDLKAALTQKMVGRELTEEVLDEVHELVLDHLVKQYSSISGLRDYLEAIKYVTIE